MLILQQTLLMGVATLGGAARAPPRGRRRTAVLGQGLAHLLLALPGAALFLVVLPRLYGFSATTHASRRSAGAAVAVHPVGQLPRPVRQHLVQAARDGGAAVHRDQPAAVLPGRRRLAGRGDPAAAARGRASSSPAPRRSTPWCASTRWTRASPTSPPTGRGCGSWRRCTWCWRPARSWLAERRGKELPMRAPPRKAVIAGMAVLAVAVDRRDRAASTGRAIRRSPAWCGRPRSASRRRSPAGWPRSPCTDRPAGAQGRPAGARSTIPSWRRRSARRRRPGRRPAPNATTSTPACAPRRSRSSPEACRPPRRTCCSRSRRSRAPARWRRATSPAASSSTRAPPSSPSRRPISTLKRAQHDSRQRRPDRRGAGAGRCAGGAGRGGGRRPAGAAGQDAPHRAGRRHGRRRSSARQGEIVPVGKPVLTLEAGAPWFAFTLREDALGGLTVGSEVGSRPTAASASPRASPSSGRSASSRPGARRAPSAITTSTVSACGSIRSAPADGLQAGMSVWLAAGSSAR